ncbi:hypothetical protein My1_051 [Pectobacterium phage My1]|uniref:Uncharacterized protein n=1 Tax=Pectobacterium phage My1 TaxID=1204539 RepID=J9QGQ7_9CAUD|nr:hypothetical protein My1_051 [Pectobacterium phage My1]AFQ22210.1 hypothetical protein My1_051 [Pectobacterium phage My1]
MSAHKHYYHLYHSNEFTDKDTLIRSLLNEIRVLEHDNALLKARLENAREQPWYTTGKPIPHQYNDGWS